MQSKQCFNQKDVRKFFEDVLSHEEVTQCLNVVKLIGYCNAQNINGRISIVKAGSSYHCKRNMPRIEGEL